MSFCIMRVFVNVCGLFDFRNFTFCLLLRYVCAQWVSRLTAANVQPHPEYRYIGCVLLIADAPAAAVLY